MHLKQSYRKNRFFHEQASLVNISFAVCITQIAAKSWAWILNKSDFDSFSDRNIMNMRRNSTISRCLVFFFSLDLKSFLSTIRAARSYSVCNWSIAYWSTRQRWRGTIRYYIIVRWDLRWFWKIWGPSARWRTYNISVAVALRNIELGIINIILIKRKITYF